MHGFFFSLDNYDRMKRHYPNTIIKKFTKGISLKKVTHQTRF